MSLSRPAWVASGLLVALGLALPAAPGQEGDKPPTITPAAPVVRQMYAVRGGSAKELANALTLHFQAEPSFRAVPDAGSNMLLLSGTKAALDDATAVLREIDHPARSVHVEVFCLELTAKAGGEAGGIPKALDGAELSGTAREVRAKIRDLQQKGIVSSIKTVELTGLTGQSARTQVSESRPYATGVSVGGFGGRGAGGGGAGTTTRSITYRNVGTSVAVKPEIGADGQVTLDLRVEDTAVRAAEGGVAVGSDDKGTAIPATEFVVFTLETRVKVRPGQIVLAQGTKAGSKAGQAQTVILVTASTDEASPKDGK